MKNKKLEPINQYRMERLFGFLQAKIMFHPKRPEILNCSNDLRLSRYFLEGEGLKKADTENYLEALRKEGGYCDCEVLLNVADKMKVK